MSGRVPPSSRSNSRRAYRAPPKVAQAARLYERFTGHDAEETVDIEIPDHPPVATYIGVCDGFLYTTIRDGKKESYIHKFSAADKPLFCVSPDGRQILLVGGRYRFTARGIVDNSDKRR